MGKASNKLTAVTNRHPATEDRRHIFLKALAETGSPIAAASAATPWSTHKQGGVATFRDLARRDPEFAAAWERAKQEALGSVEREIHRRAMEPPRRPVWEKGQVKGWVEDRSSSDKLLLRLAARLDPAWRERTGVDTNVTVQGTMLAITPEDILLLAQSEQEIFMNMLRKIADGREEEGPDEVPRLPEGSGHDPTS